MSQKNTIQSALKVSLIVGVILNLINQGDAIFAMDFGHINYYKLILTFAVPFIVSVYASIQTKKDLHKENN
jgi:hypothetical protein